LSRATFFWPSRYQGVRLMAWACRFVAVAVTLGSGGGVASAQWHSVGRIDRAALSGLSCPSTSLCIAVDGAGHVVTSTRPQSTSAWTVTDVDGANALTGVACPSSALCVATDAAGNVITSTNPAGGAAAWQITNVAGTSRIYGVSCASAALCAVSASSILVSTNPGGGSGAWADTQIGGHPYYSCDHAGMTGPGCDAPPTVISCPTQSFCGSVDDAGGAWYSSNPAGGRSAWSDVPFPDGGEFLGGACLSSSLCLAACPAGVAAGGGLCPSLCPDSDLTPQGDCPGNSGTREGSYESGWIARWNPSNPRSEPRFTLVSADDPVTQIWCVSSALCFATDGITSPGLASSANGTGHGHFYVSTNPTGGISAWSTTYNDRAAITGVSCPGTAFRCIAVDSAGNLLTGQPPASAAQVRAQVHRQLAPRGTSARIPQLLKHNGYSLAFTAPRAGLLTIAWHVHGRLIATARASFPRAITRRISIRLNRTGRRLLAQRNHLRITATARFAPPGNPAVTTTRTFTLKH
jgi:hypothetical protein